VSDLCNKIAVMYAGEIVEGGGISEILKNPRHPYTKALLSAIPKKDNLVKFNTIPGSVSDLASLPSGCKFNPRCPRKIAKCMQEDPQLECKENRFLRCFNP